MTMTAQNSSGATSEIRPIKHESLTELPAERLMGLQNSLLNVADESDRRRRLKAFWKLWARENSSFAGTALVKVYRDTVSSLPEDKNHNLLRRELVCEFQVESP